MISETSLIAMKFKLVLASAVALLAFLADVTASPEPAWESYTLKGILLIAVVYLVRELSAERANNRAESTAREARMITAMEEMTEGHRELVQATKEQTTYFRDVAKTLIDKSINP